MKKSSLIGLLMLLLMMPTAWAEMNNAIVHFKNGEKLECKSDFVSINTKKFKIRRDVNSRKEVIKKDDVAIVELIYNDGTEYAMCNVPYVSGIKAIKGDYSKPKNDLFLPLVAPGFLSLFHYTVDGYNHYFLKRMDVDCAIHLSDGRKFNGNSVKAMIMYLSDYAELCENLSNRKVETSELKGIVQEYNQWKAKQMNAGE